MACCPCNSPFDKFEYGTSSKEYIVKPSEQDEETINTCFHNIFKIIRDLKNRLSKEVTTQIQTTISSYTYGNPMPAGFVAELQMIVTKYDKQIQKRELNRLKVLIIELQQFYGYEKSEDFLVTYSSLIPSSIKQFIYKLMKSKTNGETRRYCKEIEKYVISYESTLSKQVVEAIYQIFGSYGYEYSPITDGSTVTGQYFNSIEILIQEIQQQGYSTFAVTSKSECSPTPYCPASMMRKVCPYGGGYCSATCEYHVVNGVSKSTCTIRVDSCKNKPDVEKLSTQQIIDELKANHGVAKTWVDYSGECSPANLCLNSFIRDAVCPLGGCGCRTYYVDHVCTLTFTGMNKIPDEIAHLKYIEQLDLPACASKSKGCDFKVREKAECESHCDGINSMCPKTFSCCSTVSSIGSGTYVCNIKHTCIKDQQEGVHLYHSTPALGYRNSRAYQRAGADDQKIAMRTRSMPISLKAAVKSTSRSAYEHEGKNSETENTLSAAELDTKDESVSIPAVVTTTTTKNSTVFKDLESDVPADSDFRDQLLSVNARENNDNGNHNTLDRSPSVRKKNTNRMM